ncbi:putative MFS siderophore transporter [Xylaria bambusicola]|uniref:putative MFS siderophore transporter n=1 Tax=Xylaria bambusicola TaxID=326684 RepID=UPI0020073C2B|nr:putative MFS siderophore transporter [Xylaria bambusicola]KAI0526219.1 putative MFS siderophore transporter [Xylaria bambusicola]
MSQVHRRAVASINMQDLSASSSTSSRAPLLSPVSSSSDGGSDFDERASYGSTSGRKDGVLSTSSQSDDDDDLDDEDEVDGRDEELGVPAHGGIQKADAINRVWSKAALVTAYLFIFLCSFANALQWQVIFNLMPYVVSEFSSHSLIPTIGIVSNVLSGVLKLPVAKIIDSWGRPQGFASMTLLAALGLVLMSLCRDVQTYAAAQVIYQVGISGFTYILEIIIADTSSLKNRSLALNFSSMPNLVTTFIGPAIASYFTEDDLWRLAFGFSALALVLLSLPLFWILILNMRKAKELGLLETSTKQEPWTISKFHRYLVEFDAVGMLLLSAGMTLILIPFSLTTKSTATNNINVYTFTLFLGFVCVIAFGFHEKRTKKPFIAFSLLCSRNVAGACLLSTTIFVAYFAWDGYYTSYLQVVHGLTITQAGYIGQTYSIGSSIWGLVVGYLIRKSDRFKWLAVVALPVHIIGGALMIIFRRPDTHIVWVVLCQILLTIGGSTLVICDQMAVMTAVSHSELASTMAILSLATYLGSAMGSSLSGAIWNSTLPGALAELLPELSPLELVSIGSDLKKQLSYPMGTPIRTAIIAAYGQSQARMCIVGTLISLLEIGAVLIWKDKRLSRSKQVKGTVL